jgi:hypothetical protein
MLKIYTNPTGTDVHSGGYIISGAPIPFGAGFENAFYYATSQSFTPSSSDYMEVRRWFTGSNSSPCVGTEYVNPAIIGDDISFFVGIFCDVVTQPRPSQPDLTRFKCKYGSVNGEVFFTTGTLGMLTTKTYVVYKVIFRRKDIVPAIGSFTLYWEDETGSPIDIPLTDFYPLGKVLNYLSTDISNSTLVLIPPKPVSQPEPTQLLPGSEVPFGTAQFTAITDTNIGVYSQGSSGGVAFLTKNYTGNMGDISPSIALTNQLTKVIPIKNTQLGVSLLIDKIVINTAVIPNSTPNQYVEDYTTVIKSDDTVVATVTGELTTILTPSIPLKNASNSGGGFEVLELHITFKPTLKLETDVQNVRILFIDLYTTNTKVSSIRVTGTVS